MPEPECTNSPAMLIESSGRHSSNIEDSPRQFEPSEDEALDLRVLKSSPEPGKTEPTEAPDDSVRQLRRGRYIRNRSQYSPTQLPTRRRYERRSMRVSSLRESNSDGEGRTSTETDSIPASGMDAGFSNFNRRTRRYTQSRLPGAPTDPPVRSSHVRRQLCSTCNLEFESSVNFVKHIQRVHVGVNPDKDPRPLLDLQPKPIWSLSNWEPCENAEMLDTSYPYVEKRGQVQEDDWIGNFPGMYSGHSMSINPLNSGSLTY
ncbi:hypothetical protein CLF_113119 [Clonorchis sinensis]|uniref:C2H2-type domain-containing protein n=1 Tax=Clonorchis sinensis TaxID=79923 RepID=G7YXN8_CLOSI|nr:hypothetical protein CLF_113119 [Clonorchis sinensis]